MRTHTDGVRAGLAVPAGILLTVSVAMVASVSAAQEDAAVEVQLPSGRIAEFLDVVTTERSEAGLTYRFRFLASWVENVDDFAALAEDMEYLCRDFVLPRLSNIGPQPPEVVVSLSEAEVEFGETRPDIIQFFEAFRIEDGTCVWEYF